MDQCRSARAHRGYFPQGEPLPNEAFSEIWHRHRQYPDSPTLYQPKASGKLKDRPTLASMKTSAWRWIHWQRKTGEAAETANIVGRKTRQSISQSQLRLPASSAVLTSQLRGAFLVPWLALPIRAVNSSSSLSNPRINSASESSLLGHSLHAFLSPRATTAQLITISRRIDLANLAESRAIDAPGVSGDGHLGSISTHPKPRYEGNHAGV